MLQAAKCQAHQSSFPHKSYISSSTRFDFFKADDTVQSAAKTGRIASGKKQLGIQVAIIGAPNSLGKRTSKFTRLSDD